MRQTGGKTKTQVARRSPILRWRTPPTLLSLSLSLPKCAPTWNQRQLSFLFYLFDRPLSTAAFGTIDETLFGTNQSTQRREIGQRGFRPVGSKNKGGDREREREPGQFQYWSALSVIATLPRTWLWDPDPWNGRGCWRHGAVWASPWAKRNRQRFRRR